MSSTTTVEKQLPERLRSPDTLGPVPRMLSRGRRPTRPKSYPVRLLGGLGKFHLSSLGLQWAASTSLRPGAAASFSPGGHEHRACSVELSGNPDAINCTFHVPSVNERRRSEPGVTFFSKLPATCLLIATSHPSENYGCSQKLFPNFQIPASLLVLISTLLVEFLASRSSRAERPKV